jgi:hypothetical protein
MEPMPHRGLTVLANSELLITRRKVFCQVSELAYALTGLVLESWLELEKLRDKLQWPMGYTLQVCISEKLNYLKLDFSYFEKN